MAAVEGISNGSPREPVRERKRKTAEEHRQIALERALRVGIREFGGGSRAHIARGLWEQLKDAGWIPEAIAMPADRRNIEWRDPEGRLCFLRAYGVYQWQAEVRPLPDEREAAEAIERKQVLASSAATRRSQRRAVRAAPAISWRTSSSTTSAPSFAPNATPSARCSSTW